MKKANTLISKRLKSWFTIEEACEYISSHLSTELTKKDLLHLVMNQEIKLSWYSMELFVTICTSEEFIDPSDSLKKTKFKGWTNYQFLDDTAILLNPPCHLNIEKNGELREFICWLINPSPEPLFSSADLLVDDQDGNLCKVLTETVKGMHGDMKRIPNLKQYRRYLIDRRTYPNESELGFTLLDLKDFVSISKKSIENGKPLHTKEKESIYTLIQLMLLDTYSYNPDPDLNDFDEKRKFLKNESIRVRKEIAIDMKKRSLSLDYDTIYKYVSAWRVEDIRTLIESMEE